MTYAGSYPSLLEGITELLKFSLSTKFNPTIDLLVLRFGICFGYDSTGICLGYIVVKTHLASILDSVIDISKSRRLLAYIPHYIPHSI